MALGTPVSGAVAYSAASGTSVSPAYPTGIAAGDAILLIIGQKPSTANGGTVTTPAGWTLIESLTGAGGYGTTLGADTGNTNLRIYAKDTVTGTETGNLAVTIGANNISWAFMVRIPVGAGSAAYGAADGQRTTAPTAGTPFTVALTNGATATNFQAGDLAIWAMCIPTDATTPSQFSAQSVTAAGATFGTAVEFNEPDSQTGNDIGGYSAYASVTAGSSTAAPSVTVTAAGTVTNVRGPIAMVRVREIGAAAQNLTPSLYTNTNSFHSPTITRSNTVAPIRYDNANTFYGPAVTVGAAQLSPARYDNPNTFYAPAITQTAGPQNLSPALYANANTFFAQAATATNAILAPLLTNTNAFYGTVVTASNAINPARYDNSNAIYGPSISQTIPGQVIAPARYDNANAFYGPTVDLGPAPQQIAPVFYANTNSFYTPTAIATYKLEFKAYENDGYVDAGYTGLALQNASQFFAPAVVGGTVTLLPGRYDNDNTFFEASIYVPGQSSGNFFAVF